jgi:signal transduction histidine kinase
LKSYSLTRRLIATVLLVQLCSTLALIASAGIFEGVSHFRTFDIMLRGRADSMLGAVQDSEDAQDNVMLDGTQAAAPKRDIYAVRDEFGRMLGQSPNWPDAAQAFETNTEFRALKVHGRQYRVLRVSGLRLVDPGDRGGGIPRHVVILYGAPTYPVWRSIAHTLSFYALLGLILLGVSGLMMFRLLRRGLEPLRELETQAAGVSVESWHFEPSESVRQVRELAPLATALEAALRGLERSFEQQRQFVGDAAHELKTSVSVIKSSLQLLMMRNRKPEEYRAGLKRAEEDCGRMEELVASMLTLAGLEAASADGSTLKLVELREVLLEVAGHFQPSAEMSDLHITIIADQEAWVLGDCEKLRLLCSNILHNALQHSAEGSEIRAHLVINQEEAELRIEDDGEGIAAEALPHVFERFFRGDGSRSRRTGGTGLGLAISKAIVQSMSGTIAIESELGRGTSVLIRLPAARNLQPSHNNTPEHSASFKVPLSQ